MKVTLTPSFMLSNEHASSSYGQGVLVRRDSGEAFGPADVLQPYPSWPWMTGAQAVERMLRTKAKKFTEAERAFVRAFTNFGK